MDHGGNRSGAGRPKGGRASHTLEAQAFREYLIQEVVKNKEAIVASLIEQAKAGKIPAAKELLDKVLGKTLDLHELQETEINERLRQANECLYQAHKMVIANRKPQD